MKEAVKDHNEALRREANEVADLAEVSADYLLGQNALNFSAVDMHMRAVTGLLNRPVDEQVFNRMPAEGRDALLDIANESKEYFVRIGRPDVLMSIGLNPESDGNDFKYEDVKNVLNEIQQEAGRLDGVEARRVDSAFRRGVKPLVASEVDIDLPEENLVDAEVDRLFGQTPYSEDGMRYLLYVFRSKARSVLDAVASIYPAADGEPSIFHHARGCLKSTLPTSYFEQDELEDTF